ncbi:MAG: FecR domain-containing protein [Polyangiaceae bacterium]
MIAPRYASLARRLLVLRAETAPPSPPDVRERASSIAAIEDAIRASGRARRRQRWAFGLAAVAASAACVAGAARFASHHSVAASTAPGAQDIQIVAHAAAGGASLMVSGAQAPLVDGRAVASGSRIVTPPNGQATLSFSTGTTASLGPGADMSIQEEGGSQLLRLDGGSVDLHVAKLVAGQRFRVDTVDTEVEVRGTRFHVEVVDAATACAGGVVTRVAVSEGVVVVRHAGVEASVAAGDVWPKGCADAGGTAPGASAGTATGHGVRVARSPVEAPSRASDLAGQNDLFAQGKAAWRRGDGSGALAAYDHLLARYPGGQLAESAWVERMRVLRSIAPDRAPACAREYLARYPSGSARPEAEALVQAGAP